MPDSITELQGHLEIIHGTLLEAKRLLECAANYLALSEYASDGRLAAEIREFINDQPPPNNSLDIP